MFFFLYCVETRSEDAKVGPGNIGVSMGWEFSLRIRVQQILPFCLCSWEERLKERYLLRDLSDAGARLAQVDK